MVILYIDYCCMNDIKFLLVKVWDNWIGMVVLLKVLENLVIEGYFNILFVGSDV